MGYVASGPGIAALEEGKQGAGGGLRTFCEERSLR